MSDLRDDDLLDELPPMGSLDDDEEVGVDDVVLDTDVDIGNEGSESVGLDDSTAGAEVIDIAELFGTLPGQDDESEEGERWTEGTEDAGDLVTTDGLEVDEDESEYGWTAENEAPSIDGWDEDLIDEPDEPSMLAPDAGEEGVDEDFSVLGDADDVELPPLAGATEDGDQLSDDIDLQEEAEIEGADLTFEEETRLSGAALPEPLPPSRVGVAYLGPDDDALAAVALAETTVFAGGEHLYRTAAEARLEILDGYGLEGQDVTSIVADPMDPARIVVGTRLGGSFRSTDGGDSFVEVNGWLHAQDPSRLSVAFFVAAEAHAHGVRLWGRTRGGALYRSDDFGDTWSSPLLTAPVAALGVARTGGVLALCVPKSGRARVAVSADGGHRWTMREVEGLEGESPIPDADHHAAAFADVLVVVREGEPEGPFLSRDAGASWERLGKLPSAGPVAIVEEAGRPVLYAALFFDGADRGVVVRAPLDTPEQAGLVLDVRRERDERRIDGRGDPEGDNRILAIAARPDGRRTQLHVATGAGLFRVEVTPTA